MKRTVIALLMLFLSAGMFAQDRLSEKEVLGTWKFKINLKEAIREEARDMGFFEGMLAKAVSGMAQEIVEEMDITFDFKKDHVVFLTINDIEEDEKEVEKLHWEINDRGQLFIEDIENDKVQVNHDGYWIFKGDRLIAIDDDGSREKSVWMERAR